MAVCVVCGREILQRGAGRRRRYCTPACRQRAYRLREEARRWRADRAEAADPDEVAELLAAVLRSPPGR